MSFAVNVRGGTGAGRKKPLRERARDWECERGHANRGYHVRCMTAGCNAKRRAT